MGEACEPKDALSRWIESDEFDDAIELVSERKTGQAFDALLGGVTTLVTGAPAAGAAAKATSGK